MTPIKMHSDRTRRHNPNALPDVEIFHVGEDTDTGDLDLEPGWYYWFCLPGCLPDSDPMGPFDSAFSAAREMRERST